MWTIVPVKNKNKIRFFKFSKPIRARVYYSHYYIDLLTGKRVSFSLKRLESVIKQISLDPSETPIVWHFFYELGDLFAGGEIGLDCLLAIEIEYGEVLPWEILGGTSDVLLSFLGGPAASDYNKRFKKIYSELLEGNIYQANLTERFLFSHDVDSEEKGLLFCSHLWRDSKKIGAYAHASFIPQMQKMFFSNSPECLFQVKNYSRHRLLWTMPIKGTLPLDDPRNIKEVWHTLKNDPKNSAELLMICDLLWNDLNRIEIPWAKVERKKFPLIVNKILHQASLISTRLSFKVNFLQILSALFPGGSVTGAPKKRSMQILKKLEEPRGFYCGSTLISYKKIFAASINIRSLSLDLKNKTATYGAGGGITVHSNQKDEYAEMSLKVESFLGLN